VPEEKLKPFLCHLKDFDKEAGEDVTMIEVVVHAPELGETRIEAMFKELGMPYVGKVRWAEKAAGMEWKPEDV
jgi:D-alanine-D-alanine ligase-like ATP-grasp enzyme